MVDYSKYQYLKVEKANTVAVVRMNRPEVLNAIHGPMHLELERIFDDLSRDHEVNVVVVTGEGRAFCAGGDVKAMSTGEMGSQLYRFGPDVLRGDVLLYNMLRVEQPIIAAVNGPAIGLGATIALFCDVIIASETAKIADTHVNVGLVAGDGGAVVWPLLCGLAKAKELLMTGDMLTAAEAERIGLVNKVVPPDELMPKAMEMANRLASGPPLAIRWTKLACNKLLKQQLNLVIDASIAYEGLTFFSKDHAEAAKAFVEKREPHFTGQ